MQKPKPVDVTAVAAIGALTGSTVVNLAEHDVSAIRILIVALSMLSVGGVLLAQIVKDMTTELYQCPVQDCRVEIRATRNHSPERLAVLREMATDHSRHTTRH
jgi:hypothetical protein